jgi:hypothetical protein
VKAFIWPLRFDVRKRIALFEGSRASPACPSDKSSMKTEISIEQWRNYTDGKTEVLGEKPVAVTVLGLRQYVGFYLPV